MMDNEDFVSSSHTFSKKQIFLKNEKLVTKKKEERRIVQHEGTPLCVIPRVRKETWANFSTLEEITEVIFHK